MLLVPPPSAGTWGRVPLAAKLAAHRGQIGLETAKRAAARAGPMRRAAAGAGAAASGGTGRATRSARDRERGAGRGKRKAAPGAAAAAPKPKPQAKPKRQRLSAADTEEEARKGAAKRAREQWAELGLPPVPRGPWQSVVYAGVDYAQFVDELKRDDAWFNSAQAGGGRYRLRVRVFDRYCTAKYLESNAVMAAVWWLRGALGAEVRVDTLSERPEQLAQVRAGAVPQRRHAPRAACAPPRAAASLCAATPRRAAARAPLRKPRRAHLLRTSFAQTGVSCGIVSAWAACAMRKMGAALLTGATSLQPDPVPSTNAGWPRACFGGGPWNPYLLTGTEELRYGAVVSIGEALGLGLRGANLANVPRRMRQSWCVAWVATGCLGWEGDRFIVGVARRVDCRRRHAALGSRASAPSTSPCCPLLANGMASSPKAWCRPIATGKSWHG